MFYDAAVRMEETGDAFGAALRWQKVVQLDPEWLEGWCRLAEALAADGRTPEAHRAWRQGGFHPRCVEQQGRAWLDDHPSWALQRFEILATLTSQDRQTDLLRARALSRIRPEEAAVALRLYLDRGGEPSDELLVATREVAEALPPADALAVLRRVSDLDAELATALAAVQLELEVDVRADELMGAAPTGLDLDQQERLARARRQLSRGDLVGARAVLEELADDVSRNPAVWAALADVRERQGDIAGADAAIRLARQLAPLSGPIHARYAELLTTHYGGRFGDEALEALERALDLGGGQAVLERHASLCESLGRPGCALRSLHRLGELGVDVGERIAALTRERPAALQLPAVPLPTTLDQPSWRALHRSRVFEERARQPGGTWDATLLERAVAEADAAVAGGTPQALNQRAHLHTLQGEVSDALTLYRRSLALDDQQVAVLGHVAELALKRDDPDAQQLIEEAADAGDAWAMVTLAEQHVRDWRLWSAWRQLERYADVHASGPEHGRAVRLRRLVRGRLAGGVGLVLLGMLVVIGIPLWRARSRRSGVPLAAFVAAHPRVAPEVVRVLSSVRHEVIKHNVSALPQLAERLLDGGTVSEGWLDRRLFGDTGALHRFWDYVDQLEGLAMRSGVRLNLAYQDPMFAPAIQAVRGLEDLRGRIGPRVVPQLEAHSEVLNREVYASLGTFIRQVCLLDLEPEMITAAWQAVVGEREEPVDLAFVVRGTVDVQLRMARSDLHDILVNLLRNALDASRQEGRTRVEVQLGVQEDFITGLVRVEIRVCDDVEKRLTTAMIRGRYIDRGLGLAVDLTSRSGGSIHVEPATGFAKAVVVRLPAGEA